MEADEREFGVACRECGDYTNNDSDLCDVCAKYIEEEEREYAQEQQWLQDQMYPPLPENPLP